MACVAVRFARGYTPGLQSQQASKQTKTKTNKQTQTQTHRHTPTPPPTPPHTRLHTHRHTDTQTHRHTDTQTHRHTDTQTHRHTHTHARTHSQRHRDTDILSERVGDTRNGAQGKQTDTQTQAHAHACANARSETHHERHINSNTFGAKLVVALVFSRVCASSKLPVKLTDNGSECSSAQDHGYGLQKTSRPSNAASDGSIIPTGPTCLTEVAMERFKVCSPYFMNRFAFNSGFTHVLMICASIVGICPHVAHGAVHCDGSVQYLDGRMTHLLEAGIEAAYVLQRPLRMRTPSATGRGRCFGTRASELFGYSP